MWLVLRGVRRGHNEQTVHCGPVCASALRASTAAGGHQWASVGISVTPLHIGTMLDSVLAPHSGQCGRHLLLRLQRHHGPRLTTGGSWCESN